MPDWIQYLTILGTSVALLVGIFSLVGQRENKAGAIARIDTNLQNNTDTLAEVKTDVKEIKDSMTCYGERIAKTEESTKSAHHRLDGHDLQIAELNNKLMGKKGES